MSWLRLVCVCVYLFLISSPPFPCWFWLGHGWAGHSYLRCLAWWADVMYLIPKHNRGCMGGIWRFSIHGFSPLCQAGRQSYVLFLTRTFDRPPTILISPLSMYRRCYGGRTGWQLSSCRQPGGGSAPDAGYLLVVYMCGVMGRSPYLGDRPGTGSCVFKGLRNGIHDGWLFIEDGEMRAYGPL